MLELSYDNEEDIPEGYAGLYKERDGKWVLTGVKGLKSTADIERLTTALTKERKDHKAARDSLALFGGLDPAEVTEKLENVDSLEAQLEALKKAKPGATEEDLAPIIEARLRQALGPVEREKTALTRKLDEANTKLTETTGIVTQLQGSIVSDSIERTIRDAAVEAKVVSHALTDVVMRARSLFEKTDDGKIVTKDGNDAIPGLTPKDWLKDMQEKAPHWWPLSAGGGANPGGGVNGGKNNPWSADNWNITAQGQYLKANGADKAAQMAERVGSKVGATRPPVK